MATVAAFSIAIALTTGDISGFAAIINGLNLPVLLLGGVLLPISLGPQWMRVLAHLDPLYYRSPPPGCWRPAPPAPPCGRRSPCSAVCVLVLGWATAVVRRAVA